MKKSIEFTWDEVAQALCEYVQSTSPSCPNTQEGLLDHCLSESGGYRIEWDED